MLKSFTVITLTHLDSMINIDVGFYTGNSNKANQATSCQVRLIAKPIQIWP